MIDTSKEQNSLIRLNDAGSTALSDSERRLSLDLILFL